MNVVAFLSAPLMIGVGGRRERERERAKERERVCCF